MSLLLWALPSVDLWRRCALFLLLFVGGRRPGLRPGGRLTFFASPKKVSKKRRPDVHALLRRVRCAAQLGRGLAKLAALKQTRALFPPKSALLAVPDGRVGSGTDGCCCAAASADADVNQGYRFALMLQLCVSGRRPGLRPGGRLTFFASPKKVSKERRPDVHALLRRVRCAAQLGRGLAKLAALKQTRALFPPKSALLAVPDGRVGSGTDGCCCAAASADADVNQGYRFALMLQLCVSGRRPGLRPGGRLTFFASPKKVSKERRPEVRATSWFPALLAPGGSPLNSLRSNRRGA